MTRRGGFLAAALALTWLASAALPGRAPGVQAVNPWTLGVAPVSMTVGVPTNVVLTVIDGSEMIGCVVFDLPAGFTVLGAGVSSVPAGSVWGAVVSGSGPTRVTFSTTTDAWRLNSGASGVFVIRVVATSSSLPAWTARAYKKFTMESTRLTGPAVAPRPFAISPAATPTLAPTPTRMTSSPPRSTPTPTPQGTATPRPVAPGSTANVSAGMSPGASAEAPTGTSSAAPSDTAAVAFASPSSGAVAGTIARDAPANPGRAGGLGGFETTVDVGALPAGGTVQLDDQAVGGIGMFAWVVPGLFLSLPGLLLFLVVVAQASFASLFVPVTRRVLGRDRRSNTHLGVRPR